MRVEAARVRKDPDRAAADRVLLQPELRVAAPEGGAVGGDADDRDEARPSSARSFSSAAAPPRSSSAVSSEAARVGRGAMLVIPRPNRQQHALLGGQQPRGETGFVEGAPEPVAGPREVVADVGGMEPGVDADEEDVEVGGDDVGSAWLKRRAARRRGRSARSGRRSAPRPRGARPRGWRHSRRRGRRSRGAAWSAGARSGRRRAC